MTLFDDCSFTLLEDDDRSFRDPSFDTPGDSCLVDPETLFVDTPVLARGDGGDIGRSCAVWVVGL